MSPCLLEATPEEGEELVFAREQVPFQTVFPYHEYEFGHENRFGLRVYIYDIDSSGKNAILQVSTVSKWMLKAYSPRSINTLSRRKVTRIKNHQVVDIPLYSRNDCCMKCVASVKRIHSLRMPVKDLATVSVGVDVAFPPKFASWLICSASTQTLCSSRTLTSHSKTFH